jgi:hypothetical protein
MVPQCFTCAEDRAQICHAWTAGVSRLDRHSCDLIDVSTELPERRDRSLQLCEFLMGQGREGTKVCAQQH